MIDYNLYGMSYLHVPMEVLKFRRSNEDDGKFIQKLCVAPELILYFRGTLCECKARPTAGRQECEENGLQCAGG